jgi:hypothetical protein
VPSKLYSFADRLVEDGAAAAAYGMQIMFVHAPQAKLSKQSNR